MKYLQVYFIFMMVLCLSCEKRTSPFESQEDCLPYSIPTIRIKEIKVMENNNIWKSKYYYDSLKRLIRRTDSGEYYNETLWKYDIDRVFTLRADSSIWIYYNLNSNGLAISPSIGIFQWEYDTSGYLIKETETVSGLGIQIRDYYYHCWNIDYCLSSGSDVNGNQLGGGKITYEYYTNKINTIGDENMGMSFRGRQNNCLLKYKISRYQSIIDTMESNIYEYDSLNRVSKEIKTTHNNIRITTFQYDD